MKLSTALAFSAVVGSIAVSPSLSEAASRSAQAAQISQGRQVAQENCQTCHAVGTRGASPNPASPPLRTLGQRYKISDLSEAFVEGVLVGHSVMPEFQLEPEKVDALLAYIQSLQPKPVKRRSTSTRQRTGG
jgi:cytochrome c